MSTPTEIVARLRSEVEDGSLESFCLELGIDLLVLFGSARTDAHSAGDVDLAYSVDFSRPKEDRPNLLDVATAFYVRYGVDAGDTMDFMNLDLADVVARYEALQKCELLVDPSNSKYGNLQMMAAREYINTAYRREYALRSLVSRSSK